MKKLIVFALILTCALPIQVGANQYIQLIFPINQTYIKASEICKKEGFSYFLVKRISYTDERGQTLEFKGASNVEGGTLVSETITHELGSSMGTVNVYFELLCFEQDPKESTAIHVPSIFNLLAAMENRPLGEEVEGSNVREVKTVEELRKEMAKAKNPIYLYFYSSRCPPSKVLTAEFAQFSKDFSSSGTFLKVRLENVPEIFDQFRIESMLALLVFKDQKEVARKNSPSSILEYFYECIQRGFVQ